MKLDGNNIGRLNGFSIKLDGLTVIAGENSTGKSTIGKALYMAVKASKYLANELSTEKSLLIKELIDDIVDYLLPDQYLFPNEIDEMMINKSLPDIDSEKKVLLLKFVELNTKISELEGNQLPPEMIQKVLELLKNQKVINIWPKLKNGKEISLRKYEELLKTESTETSSDINLTLINRVVTSEFKRQIHNVFNESTSSTIKLFDDNKLSIDLGFKNNSCIKYNFLPIPPYKSILYIDDSCLIDNSSTRFNNIPWRMYSRRINNFSFYDDHLTDCRKAIRIENRNESSVLEEMNQKKLVKNFYSFIRELIDGEFDYSKENKELVFKKGEKEISLNNIATGAKTFGMIEILLKNRLIGPGTCIILDEPESHLHPEWQIKFAELLVHFVKILPNVNILINSHSPFFIEAIQQYSKKYKIINQCNYYYIEQKQESSKITDVTDDISKIYDSLARPYLKLDEVYKESL